MSVPIADVDSDVVAFLRRAASVRVSPEFDFRSIAEGTELLQPSLKERNKWEAVIPGVSPQSSTRRY
jgi:hypothetical protein